MKKNIFAILIIFASFLSVLAEDEDIKKALPLILSNQTSGNEFYLTFHPCWDEQETTNSVRVYASSAVATKVTLEIEGIGFKQTQITIPNEVIEFKLTPSQAQMYSKSAQTLPEPLKVWKKRAIHITSEDPIIVYGITRYKSSSDGYLAIPVNALGKKYIASSWADPGDEKSQWLTSYISVVGIYDNTQVTFTAGGGELTGNVLLPNNDTLNPNESTKTTLFPGDVWLVPSIGPFSDLTGSKIVSDKPVAVISGNYCTYIPSWVSACNFIIEQEIPCEMYSNIYFVSPIKNRLKNSWIKIFCKQPQTKIYRDGIEAGMIQTPGGIKNKGYLEILADEGKPRGVVYTSDPGNPIHIVQYNSGQSDDGIASDPFQMNLLSTDLFQNEIIFNTPGIKGGLGFKNKCANLIFKKTVDGKIPDDLEFGIITKGNLTWEKVNKLPDSICKKNVSDFTYIDPNDKRAYAYLMLTLPGDNIYHFRSKDKIAAYLYGSDYFDSYGYPANFNPKTLEKKDIDKPSVTIIKKEKASLSINIYDEPKNDPQNRSELSSVSLINSQCENMNLEMASKLIAGTTSSINVKLSPKDPAIPCKALILAKDYAGNDTIFKFTIYPTNIVIPKPVLVFPVDNAENIMNNIDFTWNKTDSALYYCFELDDNPEFSKPNIYKTNISDTILNVKSLLNDFIYYWRVKAYSEIDSSEFSNASKFSMISSYSGKPILIKPGNNDENLNSEINFSWKSSLNTTNYKLIISEKSDFDPIFKKVENLTDTTIQISGFETDKKYYWKVISNNNLNKANESEIWIFNTIKTLPEIPQLIVPTDKSVNVFSKILFVWKSGINHKSYKIEIDDNQDFSSIFKTVETNDTTISIEDFNPSTIYYWRVIALNANNQIAESEIRSFTTNSLKPNMAELVYPQDAAKDLNRDVELLWVKNILIDNYQVQVAYDKEFANKFYDTLIGTNSFRGNLDKNTTFYWRVKSFNKFGESDWTPTRSFTTNDITSVLESELDKTTVSPNPAKDHIRISLNGNHKPNYIHLLNSKGELVDEIEFDGINNEINYNLAKIPSGEYNLLISYPNNTVVRKIVVIK